ARERCYELFSRLAFRTLLPDYAPTADTTQKDYQLVTSVEALDALTAEIAATGQVALHVLQDEPLAMRASIVGIAFSLREKQARYVPFGMRTVGGGLLDLPDTAVAIDAATALAHLKGVLEDDTIRKVGHDIKAAAIVLARQGVTLRGL